MELELRNRDLVLCLDTQGGMVWRFAALAGSAELPLFRQPPPTGPRDVLSSGCFPLVPFANRVRGNRFSVDGRDYELAANMGWDPHYLHGDGWTGTWQVAAHAAAAATLRYRHDAAGAPYRYEAVQDVSLAGPELTMRLEVTNLGPQPMPFGLGWHPYFPLGPRTRLRAAASAYWEEGEQWLPTVRRPVAGDLDFSVAAALPRRWVNTPFEGWDGSAEILWPDRGLALGIRAGRLFDRYLVFVSDPAFDPGYAYDFFAFEPMSHSIDAHNSADGGGLVRLAQGESLAGEIRFVLRRLDKEEDDGTQ